MSKHPLSKALILCLFVLGAIGQALAQAEVPTEVQNLFGSAFKEEKTVPRGTFAKALAGFLQIAPSKSEKCFKNLKKGAPENRAVCALKKAKIITGKTFKPKNKTTFEFAVQTLCRAGKWTKKKTWKACSDYAKEHGLFAAPFPEKPSKRKKITYGQLALLMSRLEQASESPPPAPSSREIPDIPETPLSFTPVPEAQISTNFFANILLKNPLPNRFYQHEIYFLEGQLVNQAAEEIFIFLCREGEGCENSIDFLGDTTDSGSKFKIPVHFQETGNFQIGVIVGRAGQSRVESVSVLPAPDIAEGGTAAAELSVEYKEGKTVFSWNGSGDFFARLTVFQNEKRRDYLFRQGTKSFSPESADFEGFQKGGAFWFVTHDTAQSDLQSMKLTAQDFRKIEDEEIQAKSLQEVYSGTPVAFRFVARSLAPISKKAAFTFPDGHVEEINFAENDLSAGKEFKIEHTLKFPGTYIFEVNNPQGSAVVNVPIFVGTEIPLIPDYFALHPQELDTSPLKNLDKAREELLSLVNKDRRDNGLLPATLIPQLNSIAQAHSQNMVDKNFFGHVDPSGFSPEDRRKKVKYPASIRENLAKAGDLEGVERGLMRSPVHRAAILDPKMTRVGLGIAKNDEGYLITTQNFSADPLSANDMPGLEDSLFEKASEKRAANSFPSVAHETALREAARAWSSRMQAGSFFGLTDLLSGDSALSLARDRGIKSSLQIHIVKVSEKDQLAEELVKQAGLLDAENRNVGIGLAVSELGELYMTAFYTP